MMNNEEVIKKYEEFIIDLESKIVKMNGKNLVNFLIAKDDYNILKNVFNIYNNLKSENEYLHNTLDEQQLQINNYAKECDNLKEKYNLVIKENLDYKYEEVLEKVFKKYIDKDFISKDKIKEKINKLKPYLEINTGTTRYRVECKIAGLEELLGE